MVAQNKPAQNNLIKKFAEKFSFANEAELVDTLKATAFKVKDGVVTDAQMMALLIVADQYGLNPFTREIFAFPDKQNGIVPVVSIDGWSHNIHDHPQFDGLEFVYSTDMIDMSGAKLCFSSIECVMYRKDRSHPVRIREFLDEVYKDKIKVPAKNGNQSYDVVTPW